MTPRSLLAPARLAGQPVLRTQSDERLVDLVRSGSDPAFEAIVARYRGALTRYCSRILPDDRAEDAVQQSFLRAYESMRAGTADLALRPWLYRIAHNTALNALRDRGLRHEELDEQIDGVERPEEALERAQGLRSVFTAVQGLPERQRDAIVLRELEGRSYEEIAAELGVTGGAVRQLLNRARHGVRAAATAVTPVGLAERLAEVSASAAGGSLVVKACATTLVTGLVMSGAAVLPERSEREDGGGEAEAAARAPGGGSDGAAGGGPSGTGDPLADRALAGVAPAEEGERFGGPVGRRSEDERESDDRDRHGGGDDHDSDGDGDGFDDRDSGSGDGELDDSHSGSGRDGSSSGSRSGSDDEPALVTGTSGSGGSDRSGSGSSGSGSSGSGSSGSGSSGSDSSGSGHDGTETELD